MASQLDKALVISVESGLLTLDGFDIDAVECATIADIREVYSSLVSDEPDYKTIYIDSLTEISNMLMSELENDSYWGDDKQKLSRWGEHKKVMESMIKKFRDLKNYNVVFTSLVEDVNIEGYMIKYPAMDGKKLQQKLTSMFDLVLYLQTDSDGNRVAYTKPTNEFTAKDRSNKLEPVISNPNLGEIFKTIKG